MSDNAPALAVRFAGLDCASPVWAASGTFGYASELAPFVDVARLGAVVTKGISLAPRAGNRAPRICETAAGMINSIGLENVGVDGLVESKLPFLRASGTRVVVNFFGDRWMYLQVTGYSFVLLGLVVKAQLLTAEAREEEIVAEPEGVEMPEPLAAN